MMNQSKLRGRSASRRFTIAAVVPVFDLLALTGAMLVGDLPARATTVFLIAASGAFAVSWNKNRTRVNPSLAEDLAAIVGRIAFAAMAAGLATPIAALPDLIRTAPIAAGLAAAARMTSYAVLRAMRTRRWSAEPTLIVGAGQLGNSIAHTLVGHPEYGLEVIGFVEDGPTEDPPVPVLGSTGELRALVERHGVRRIIVTYGSSRDAELVPVLRGCEGLSVEIFVVQRFHELAADDDRGEEIWGYPIVRLSRGPFGRPSWRLKRLLDITAASIGIAVSGPILAACALAVRLSGPGPILFRQQRVGRHGETIEIVKFRTLHVNDDSDTTWSVAGDERRTTVGRVLRKTHLDELPQLFGILRGQMSLVGPRPERPYFVEAFSEEVERYADRHRVPVGLTGWAQVHGLNGDTSIVERARFDNRYIERWSLWRDVVTLVRTATSIARSLVENGPADDARPVMEGSPTDGHDAGVPDVTIDLREIDIRDSAVRSGNGNGNGHSPRVVRRR